MSWKVPRTIRRTTFNAMRTRNHEPLELIGIADYKNNLICFFEIVILLYAGFEYIS